MFTLWGRERWLANRSLQVKQSGLTGLMQLVYPQRSWLLYVAWVRRWQAATSFAFKQHLVFC
jgi:hypothetical protein